MKAVAVLVGAALVVGCSLPGYHLDSESQDSAWYGTDPRHESAADDVSQDYEATVREITPSLIRTLERKQSERPVEPTPEALAPDTNYPSYHVGRGDLLNVIVYGHPELNNPMGTSQNVEASGRLVDAEGEIYFPFVGDIQVAGLTVDQIRRKLAEGLSKVLREPQVDVRVLRYRSKRVMVTGDISQPCAVPITDVPMTVYEALGKCESSQSGGRFSVQALRLVRDDETYALDLDRIYRREEPFWLEPGDRLVIDNRLNRVFLIGEFAEQTTAQIAAGGMTLADAMAEAGGLDLDTADTSSIYVIRGFVEEEPGPDGEMQTRVRPDVYRLDASSAEALILADQFELRPRDVVFAAPADLVNVNRALALITPSLNTLFQTYLIFDRGRD